MEVLTNNHYDKILDLFEGTKKEIKIISPFISESIAIKLCELVEETDIKCRFITRFYLEDMFAKANSIDAIEMMMDAGITVYALKGLHTKLYLFDDTDGVLGSANFTAGGFKSNIELSLLLNQEDNILPELHSYFETLVEQIQLSDEGVITKEVIDDARKKYKHLLSAKKDKGKTTSSFMYGASIDRKSKFETTSDLEKELNKAREDIDIVDGMFNRNSAKEQLLRIMQFG